AQALRGDRPGGISEIVEGVRSLLVAVDDSRIALSWLADHLASLTASLDDPRSEEHTSELQSLTNLVCRLLLEKKKNRPNSTKQRTCTNDKRITEHTGKGH